MPRKTTPQAPASPDPAAGLVDALRDGQAPPGEPEGAEKGGDAPLPDSTGLAGAVDPFALAAGPAGDLDPATAPPADPAERALPPAIAGTLNARELRTVWHMVAGKSYQDALTASGVKPRATLRDSGPPEHVLAAVQWIMRDLAHQCAVSGKWILTQTVALYRRAVQAEPVFDRRGVPTGEYRLDGATAARCLELLGKHAGVFGGKAEARLSVNEVAALLSAVADRGRPGRVLDQASAAPQLAAPRNVAALGRGGTTRDGSGA